jgi:hypothetical protein
VARVLTTASSVDCGHGGTVSTTGEPKLRVAGAPVLLAAGINGKSVAPSCTLVDNAETSTLKCRLVTSVTGGAATKLRVSGAPVMLDTLAGGTDGKASGTPAQLLRATAGQTKMEAS